MLPPETGQLRKESGIIGIEAAIMVIALVVVSVGFANAALTSGLLFSKTAQDTVQETLGRLDAMELRGSVVVTASITGTSGVVSDIVIQVSSAGGGESIDLTPGKIIVKYSDSNQSRTFDSPSSFSVTGLGSTDSDMLLEPNELYEIKLSGLDSTGGGPDQLTDLLGPGTMFSVEVIPPNGAVLLVQRMTPTSLDAIMRLN
jgi:archaellin